MPPYAKPANALTLGYQARPDRPMHPVRTGFAIIAVKPSTAILGEAPMNSLHDAQAWELVRLLAQAPTCEASSTYKRLRSEACSLLAQVDTLREAHTMIAHLQEIRLGLLEALRDCKDSVENQALPPSARLELVRDYATPAILAAEAGKVPPSPQLSQEQRARLARKVAGHTWDLDKPTK